MDARGLREWAKNLLDIQVSLISNAEKQDQVDELIDSITPEDPWEFLDEGFELLDEKLVRLEQEYPKDIQYIIED